MFGFAWIGFRCVGVPCRFGFVRVCFGDGIGRGLSCRFRFRLLNGPGFGFRRFRPGFDLLERLCLLALAFSLWFSSADFSRTCPSWFPPRPRADNRIQRQESVRVCPMVGQRYVVLLVGGDALRYLSV